MQKEKKEEGRKKQKRTRGNEKLDQLEMTVPQLTGVTKAIKLLKSSKAVKNLGLFVRPDGMSDMHMLQMKDRMKDWTK